MKKIGLTGIWFPEAYQMLHESVPAGMELVDAVRPEDAGRLSDCDYLITRLTLDGSLAKRTPKLRLLQLWGAGYEYVDLAAWGRRGIPVCNCPGVNAGIVSELAVMLMLAGYRNLLQINRDLRRGHFPRTEYFGRSYMLRGKTVGILGLGRIGRRVAGLVSAFGAKVIYYDIVRQREQEERFGYRFVDFGTLLSESDILSIHCPLKEDTRGMIGPAEFAAMKKSAMLINTARGPIVDEDALVHALRTGQIALAGLDVYAKEPIPADHPLLTMDNVVASAHAGGNTADNTRNMVDYVMGNIAAFDAGASLNSPEDVVNRAFLEEGAIL